MKNLICLACQWQVSVEAVHIVGWIDLTKIGVLTQKDIGNIGSWSEKLLAKNPLCNLP